MAKKTAKEKRMGFLVRICRKCGHMLPLQDQYCMKCGHIVIHDPIYQQTYEIPQ